MTGWDFDGSGFEDLPEGFEEDIIEAHFEEPEEQWAEPMELDPEVPDVYWSDYILGIENQVLREEEIARAEQILGEYGELDAKFEAGEMDPVLYKMERLVGPLPRKASAAATRAGLAAQGLTWDHLVDLGDDYDSLVNGDLGHLDLKQDILHSIAERGPEYAQQRADQMLEDGQISEEAHESISRLVRIARRNQG